MKHFFTFLTLAVLGFVSAFGQNAIKLETVGGKTMLFALDAEPVMTFDNNTLKVTATSGDPVTISIDDVAFFTFVNADLSEVGKVDMEMTWDAGTLTLSGIDDSTPVDIYSLDGSLISRGAPTDGRFTLNPRQLQPGVYVLRAGNFAIKLKI